MAVFYDDALKLRDFAEALEQAEYADADDVIRKPYKFEKEYEVWAANSYPQPTDGEWDEFIVGLNALNEE